MIWENIKLHLKLFYRPVAAVSGIIDEGSVIYSIIAVLAITLFFDFAVTTHIYANYETAVASHVQPFASSPPQTQPQEFNDTQPVIYDEEGYAEEYEGMEAMQPQQRPLPLVGTFAWRFISFSPTSVFMSLLILSLIYVPGTIMLMVWLDSLGSFGVVLRRDYGSLLNCTLVAWAASHLPFAVAGIALISLNPNAGLSMLMLWLLSLVYFAVLMVCALRTIFGTSFSRASFAVSLSWIVALVGSFLFGLVSPWLFSPFILYYVWIYFRGDIGDINYSFRQRQNFRRCLESATINPRDAEAHYQLGLVYTHRRQYGEAIPRFRRAIEIDPNETDAHFQLGRIAREQGKLQEAIDCFNTVVSQNELHSHSEIWREIGATYIAAVMYEEAREALERFAERRPYDPEGLYYLGYALEKLGCSEESRETFQRCIEAVKTMPYYRRSQLRKWRRLAQKQLSTFRADSSLATS